MTEPLTLAQRGTAHTIKPQYWKHKLAHGFHYAVKQLHFEDRGSALKWVCDYHPAELTEAQEGWSEDSPMYSQNIWADIPPTVAGVR